MSPILGIIASQNYPRETNSYESIATTTLSTTTATITFSSIPQTYKHLQIRALARGNAATNDDSIVVQFNGDTGGNYSSHYIYGTGSSAASGGASGAQTSTNLGRATAANLSSGIFGVSIADILDYTNTNKYTTTRTLCGFDSNGGGITMLLSGSWRNTAAVTSIDLFSGAGSFIQYSHFALYGIKG